MTLDIPYVAFAYKNDPLKAKEYVKEFIRRFIQKIDLVTVSESRPGLGAHCGISNSNMGWWLDVIRELKSNRYNGDIIVEAKKLNECIDTIKKLHLMVGHLYN